MWSAFLILFLFKMKYQCIRISLSINDAQDQNYFFLVLWQII